MPSDLPPLAERVRDAIVSCNDSIDGDELTADAEAIVAEVAAMAARLASAEAERDAAHADARLLADEVRAMIGDSAIIGRIITPSSYASAAIARYPEETKR